MAELLKGLLGGGWILLAGWYLPSGLVVSLFAFFIFPAIGEKPPFSDVTNLDTTQRTFALLGIALALATLLNSLQTPLYRLLEGYVWPARLQERRIVAQRAAKQRAATHAAGKTGLMRLLSLETRYERFPVGDDQIAPTRLGNAIRRFEEYGYERYGLDSQLLWEELWACAPEAVTAEIDRAQAKTDFFVCLTYLSALFAAATLTTAAIAGEGGVHFWIWALLAAGSCILWYRLAILTTDNWAYNVKALVNLGRVGLAEKLGLELPQKLGEERRMWLNLKTFLEKPYSTLGDEERTALDAYRRGPAAPETARLESSLRHAGIALWRSSPHRRGEGEAGP